MLKAPLLVPPVDKMTGTELVGELTGLDVSEDEADVDCQV